MLAEKTIEIYKDILYLNGKEDFLLDVEAVFSFLRTYGEGKKFKKIEIDFGSAFLRLLIC